MPILFGDGYGEGKPVVVWIVVMLAALALAALAWWSAAVPDREPGDKLARRFRDSGGWSGSS